MAPERTSKIHGVSMVSRTPLRTNYLDERPGIAHVSVSQRAGAPGRLYLCRAINAYT